MSTLLFEIGTEELPPDSINSLSSQIRENLCNKLNENNIPFNKGSLITFTTPRRIAITINDLSNEQPVKIIEVKGPDKTKAFNPNGTPTQAAIGFAKKYNLEPKDLQIKTINNIEYVFITTKTGGNKTVDILKNILPESIKQTTGKKFMRWGNNIETFSRPIRWILALFDSEVVPFSYTKINSGKYTYGNRFSQNKSIEINSFDEYKSKLLANHVILENEDRKNKIINELEALPKNINGKAVINKELIEEVTNITEYPSSIICSFDKDFLSLPECIIETVLKKHQKNFIIKDLNNNLLPDFITFTNGIEHINKEKKELIRAQIKKGNEKVVKARLSDAQFFYKEDLKKTFTYEERINDLRKITFQKGLGSLEEKVTRITEISQYIYHEISKMKKLSEDLEDITTTAKLCKLDLSTHLVFEFTELQGEIGAIYAKHNRFNDFVSKGIQEHYYPRFLNDKLPETYSGLIVSLADKIDNLICLFSIGKIPTGSADPFALRRQAQAIIEQILAFELRINLIELISHIKENILVSNVKLKFDSTQNKLLNDFLIQRFISTLENLGYEQDLILSVTSISNPLCDLVSTRETISSLKDTFVQKEQEHFKSFLTAAKRLVRIVENTNNGGLSKTELITEHEKSLFNKLEEFEIKLNKKTYKTTKEFLSDLSSLTEPINNFFNNVLVNDPDPKIKKTRQALMKKGKMLFENICDFNHIQERN